MTEREPPTDDPIPAATLVIFRNGRAAPEPELLMVVRSNAMAFAGGAAVFPGGRVDPADRALADRLALGDDRDEWAHRIAAIRETLEETGLVLGLTGELDAGRAVGARSMLLETGELAPVLEVFDLAIDPEALIPFARWLPTGLNHARIFDTRFYLANLGTGAVDIAVDATENSRLFWVTAREALVMAEHGEIKVIFPTRRNLERLAQFASFSEARDHALATPIFAITPEIDKSGRTPLLRIPEGAGYPITAEPLTNLRRI